MPLHCRRIPTLTPRPRDIYLQKGTGRDETHVADDGWDGTMYFNESIQSLRGYIRDATIGYATMNLVDPPVGTFWGKFNNRIVIPGWVTSLVAHYKNRLDNCIDAHAIDVAVRPEWLADAEKVKKWKTVQGYDVEVVPELEFTDAGLEAIKRDNLWVLGGNHRRLALCKYIEDMKTEVDKQSKNLRALIKKDKDGNPPGQYADQIAAARGDIQNMTNEVLKNHKWVIRLYDRGTRLCIVPSCAGNSLVLTHRSTAFIDALPSNTSRAVYRLLSRNESTGSVKVTEEELLQEIIDSFKDKFEEDDKALLERYAKRDQKRGRPPTMPELKEMEEDYEVMYPTVFGAIKEKAEHFKGNSTGYRQICLLPRVALGLIMASRVRSHYTHADWFRISILKNMVQVHGGVSGHSCAHSFERKLTNLEVYQRIYHRVRRVLGAHRQRQAAADAPGRDREDAHGFHGRKRGRHGTSGEDGAHAVGIQGARRSADLVADGAR